MMATPNGKGPHYTHFTYSLPCEFCGSEDKNIRGRTVHELDCIRTNKTDIDVLFKYGFHVGQIVATTCIVEFEGKRQDGKWFNEKVPAGTLFEIMAIAPKVTTTSDRMVKEYPHRFDDRSFFYVARLADGSRRESIREHFTTIRQLNRDDLAQYRRGLAERRDGLALIKQAAPFAQRLKDQGIEIKGHDVYVGLAKIMFNTNKPDLDQMNLAQRLSFNLVWGQRG